MMFKKGRSDYPKIFISHKIEVRESSIHGRGVFAKERLDFHELIEAAPVVLMHKDSFGERAGASELSMAGSQMEGYGSQLRILGLHDRHVVMDYAFDWKGELVAFPMGWAGVYNHSTENPNAIFRQNHDYESIDFFTRRVIEPNEEITIRYVPYKHCDKLWFVSDEENSVLDQPLETVEASSDGGFEDIRHRVK